MAKRELPTPEELRQLLRYEPDTGKLFHLERPVSMFTESTFKGTVRSAEWACRVWNANRANKEAGYYSYGYKVTRILGHHMPNHRIAWAMTYGHWPTGQVDHLNGIRDDNRIANLRDVPRDENQRNMRRSRANTSGHTGVYWNKRARIWVARIEHKGVQYSLGCHHDIEDAKRAVDAKRKELGFVGGHGSDRPRYHHWSDTA